MHRCAVCLTAVLLISCPLAAQTPASSAEEFPARLLQWLEPGTYIEISPMYPDQPNQQGFFRITIFENEGDFNLAFDATSKSDSELRSDYPRYAQAAETATLEAGNASAVVELVRPSQARLGRVVHTGDDYALLKFRDAGKREAIAEAAIHRVDWFEKVRVRVVAD